MNIYYWVLVWFLIYVFFSHLTDIRFLKFTSFNRVNDFDLNDLTLSPTTTLITLLIRSQVSIILSSLDNVNLGNLLLYVSHNFCAYTHSYDVSLSLISIIIFDLSGIIVSCLSQNFLFFWISILVEMKNCHSVLVLIRWVDIYSL